MPILALASLALLFALWAGLLRIGWTLPSFPTLAVAHGPLMVSGFLGVLIPLERAVAIRQKWMFAVPICAGLGWIALLFVPFIGGLLLTLASLGALMILGVMVRREPHLHTVTMFVGMLAWVAGNFLWMSGSPVFQIVYLWMAFLVLTIAGERLELSRVLRPASGQLRIFSIIAAALSAGAILALFDLNLGARLNGLSLLALSLWFLKNDLARRNIRHPNPLTRYIAFCLFAGFLWLGLGGLLLLYFGGLYAGPYYDAALHAVFVGFVISMIFGHAPIIFPAILGVPITYRTIFYAHLMLLHLSLIIRILGDLTDQFDIRRWGGFLNEIAILLFLGMTIYSIVKAQTPALEKDSV
ncbi:MAG: hypothetical protein EHM33_20710 [Chloroflexi bacterium]|nr:MAG: hypothetical protein EHM33_20710 [Chloroflexota bacterium]